MIGPFRAARELVIVRRRLGRRGPVGFRRVEPGGVFSLLAADGDEFEVVKRPFRRGGAELLYPADAGRDYSPLG